MNPNVSRLKHVNNSNPTSQQLKFQLLKCLTALHLAWGMIVDHSARLPS